MTVGVEDYVSRLRRSGDVTLDGGRIGLSLRRDVVDIGGAPPNSVVSVRIPDGLAEARLSSEARGDPPAWLTVAAPLSCARVRLDGAPARRLTVHVHGQDLDVDLTDGACARWLRIVGTGAIRVTTDRLGVLDLLARSGSIAVDSGDGLDLRGCRVDGPVDLRGGGVDAELLSLRDGARIGLAAPVRARRLRTAAHPAALRGPEHLTVDAMTGRGVVHLDDATVAVGSHPGRFAHLLVSGRGAVVVRGEVARLELPATAADAEVELVVEDGGAVLEVSGSAGLTASPRAIVRGSADGSFRPARVRNVRRAAVQQVSPFGLRALDDLTALKRASQVTFAFPRRMARARQLADSMTIEASPASPAASAGTQFWEQAADLLAHNRATAEASSTARYLAARSRRRNSRPASRERVVYSAYGLVGYGERAVQPMVVYAVLGALLAMVLVAGEVGSWAFWSYDAAQFQSLGRSWSRVLQSPLAIFAFGNRPPLGNAVEELLLVGYQALGVTLVGISILAIRRTMGIGPFAPLKGSPKS